MRKFKRENMILHFMKFIFSKQYRKQCSISDVMCSCGKYERCTRKIKVKDGGYFGNTKLYVDTKDHFRCGKVQNQILKMKNVFNNYGRDIKDLEMLIESNRRDWKMFCSSPIVEWDSNSKNERSEMSKKFEEHENWLYDQIKKIYKNKQ